MRAPVTVLPMGRRVRIREAHVRDHLAPLLSRGGDGAVKLDLLLRALVASSRRSAGVGILDPAIGWDVLHDAVRPGTRYARDGVLKRKWVGDKLRVLETLHLLRREDHGASRPRVVVLRDDGNGGSFDDPGESAGQSYVTVLGSIFTTGRAAHWGTPEVAAYLAAMIAERYARADPRMAHLSGTNALGDGVWMRPLDWFADPEGRRPAHHIRTPFSSRTLRRGIGSLEAQGAIVSRWIAVDPRTRAAFTTGNARKIYINGFQGLASGVTVDERRVARTLRSVHEPSDQAAGGVAPESGVDIPAN